MCHRALAFHHCLRVANFSGILILGWAHFIATADNGMLLIECMLRLTSASDIAEIPGLSIVSLSQRVTPGDPDSFSAHMANRSISFEWGKRAKRRPNETTQTRNPFVSRSRAQFPSPAFALAIMLWEQPAYCFLVRRASCSNVHAALCYHLQHGRGQNNSVECV